ncbi:protein FAM219B [Amazona ochrocephala]
MIKFVVCITRAFHWCHLIVHSRLQAQVLKSSYFKPTGAPPPLLPLAGFPLHRALPLAGGGKGRGAGRPWRRAAEGLVPLIWAENQRLSKAADAVEKKGPYIVSKPPSIHAKLKQQRELAKVALRRQGLLGAPAPNPKPAPKRSVKFNKGYTALSQVADENLLSLDSDSDEEPGSRCSSGYSSAEQVNQDLSRQLLQDGYHLDEVPDDEDLDLIPPKPITSSSCPCCFGDNLSCVIQ